MSEDSKTLTLLAAILNKEEYAKRASDMADQERRLNQRLAAAQEQEAKNQAILDRAAEQAAEAQRLRRAAEEHEARLKDFEANLGVTNNAINAEKARWEEMRQRVDAEHKAESDRLAKHSATLSELDERLSREHDELIGLRNAADSKNADVDAKLRAIRALHEQLAS